LVGGGQSLSSIPAHCGNGIIILHNEIAPGMEKLMQAFMKTLPVKDQAEDGGH